MARLMSVNVTLSNEYYSRICFLPTGVQVVEITEECACRVSCYRMSYLTSSFNMVRNSTTGTLEQQSVQLDVGKCVGTCSQNMYKCVLRY